MSKIDLSKVYEDRRYRRHSCGCISGMGGFIRYCGAHNTRVGTHGRRRD